MCFVSDNPSPNKTNEQPFFSALKIGILLPVIELLRILNIENFFFKFFGVGFGLEQIMFHEVPAFRSRGAGNFTM